VSNDETAHCRSLDLQEANVRTRRLTDYRAVTV
jgi:hypothetical protein